jgi:radical SAM enzyme (TIGR01210 family)
MTENLLLTSLGLKESKNRRLVPTTFNSTIEKNSDSFARLWVKTRGCSHSINKGGCVACDYWIADIESSTTTFSQFKNDIDSLATLPPKLLLINSNGSFFDIDEINRTCRQKMLKYLFSALNDTIVIFETRIETINEDVLTDLSLYDSSKIMFEMGVEAITLEINALCCNKGLNLAIIKDSLDMLKKSGIKSLSNIMIGLPFLTPREIVDEAVKTINECFKLGFDGCVLFPVNVKPYTSLKWLYSNDIYEVVSLWALVQVLSEVDEELLQNIEISWCPNYKYTENPSYEERKIIPSTCNLCADNVNKYLTEYDLHCYKRKAIIDSLMAIKCECKTTWHKSLLKYTKLPPLLIRLEDIYIDIGDKAFGKVWINQHKNEISQLLNSFKVE